MRVAITGCVHGELKKLYETIKALDDACKKKTELVLVNGDFQSIRNQADLDSMSCPDKYKTLGDFQDYFTRKEKAYCLTVFIGGNHEASNLLIDLFYGGWVAPNIYYLGVCNVINIGGIRIAGISGIYKNFDYHKGYYEKVPLNQSTKRSIYHVREFAVKKISMIKSPIDIILSHDWPCGITAFGNLKSLLKRKPYFEEDIKNNSLGNPYLMDILLFLKPKFWFSAHLHVHFEALVHHNNEEKINEDEITIEEEDRNTEGKEKDVLQNNKTQFIALDKCLKKRSFVKIMEIKPHEQQKARDNKIYYDKEWLAITKTMAKYTPINRLPTNLDKDLGKEAVLKELERNKKFIEDVYKNYPIVAPHENIQYDNPKDQTSDFCAMLGIGEQQLSSNNIY